MGNCCNSHLLVQLPNNTKVYYQCSEKTKKQSKIIDIRLEDNVFIIEPNKDDLIETSDVQRYKSDEGILQLLVGPEGIKTRESRIKQSFEQILDMAADKSKKIVFDQPKINYENTKKLFRHLIYAIIKYDECRQERRLSGIYLPWSDKLTVQQMKNYYQEEKQKLDYLSN